MMKHWRSLFELCTVEEGDRNSQTVGVTMVSYIPKDGDKEALMKKRLQSTGEYIVLRGKADRSYPGLLREVNIAPAFSLNMDGVRSLERSLPAKYRKNAVFMMNVVTLNKLFDIDSIGDQKQLRGTEDGDFTLMGFPVVLCNSMPCPGKQTVPILFGDFSQIRIEDCGHSRLREEPFENSPEKVTCSMTGYLNCEILDRDAVWGMKIL